MREREKKQEKVMITIKREIQEPTKNRLQFNLHTFPPS